MYKKILKNNTSSDIVLSVLGFTLPASSQIEVNRMSYNLLGNENAEAEWLPYIMSGDIIVSDGNTDLPVRVGIGLLKSNPVILQEFYTLTQDDDILIGNGQILHLHEEDWNYSDDETEDDSPTQG